ncbi:MAG: cyclic nucleotide-binding domain-containing protein [Pseudomonadota bacterium]
MDDLEPVLRDHQFLRGFREDLVEFMVGCATEASFAPGEFLIKEGGDANVMFLIRSGRVALEIDMPGKGPVDLETLEPGDIVGISWLFPPFRWTMDVRAVDSVTALAFDAQCLRSKMEADNSLGYAIAKRLIARLGERLKRARLQRLDMYRAEM